MVNAHELYIHCIIFTELEQDHVASAIYLEVNPVIQK